MNYFRFVAQEVRELLASLGVKSLRDLIGHTEYLEILEARPRAAEVGPRAAAVEGWADGRTRRSSASTPSNAPFDKGELAEKMVSDMLPAIEAKTGGEWRYDVRNFNRSIGARLSGEIARRWGNYGMEEAPLAVRLSGNVGQSFGVWNAGGLHLISKVMPTTTWVRAWRRARSCCATRVTPGMSRKTPSSWVTPACMAPPAATCSPPALRVSVLPFVTPAPSR